MKFKSYFFVLVVHDSFFHNYNPFSTKKHMHLHVIDFKKIHKIYGKSFIY